MRTPPPQAELPSSVPQRTAACIHAVRPSSSQLLLPSPMPAAAAAGAGAGAGAGGNAPARKHDNGHEEEQQRGEGAGLGPQHKLQSCYLRPPAPSWGVVLLGLGWPYGRSPQGCKPVYPIVWSGGVLVLITPQPLPMVT